MSEKTTHGYPMVECFARVSRAAGSVWMSASEVHVRVPHGAALETGVREKINHYVQRAGMRSSILRCDNQGLISLTVGLAGAANLICVHASHGSIYDYRYPISEIDASYPVYALHALRYLIGKQSSAQSLEALAEEHVKEMLRNQLCDIPFVLYGVSTGGLLALEMAVQLSERRKAPAFLVLGDTRDLAGRLPAQSSLGERYLWLTFVAAYLPISLLPLMLGESGGELWACADAAARCRLLVRRAREMEDQTYAVALDPDELLAQVEAHRLFLRAYWKYKPRAYSGSTVFVKGTVAPAELSEGVRSVLPAEHEVVEILGNHISLLTPEGGRTMASLLDRKLAAAAAA